MQAAAKQVDRKQLAEELENMAGLHAENNDRLSAREFAALVGMYAAALNGEHEVWQNFGGGDMPEADLGDYREATVKIGGMECGYANDGRSGAFSWEADHAWDGSDIIQKADARTLDEYCEQIAKAEVFDAD